MLTMKRTFWTKTLLITAGLPLLAGCIVEPRPRRVVVVEQPAPAEVVVDQPSTPPPAQVEVQPASPGPAYVWVGGCYEWHAGWVWVRGRWAVRPRPGAVWVGGVWIHHRHGYVWVGGHWR